MRSISVEFRTVLAIFLAVVCLCGNIQVLQIAEAETPSLGVVVSSPAWLRAERASNSAIRIWWPISEGASGYVVYRKVKFTGKLKAVKTINSGVETTWTDVGLPTRKSQTYLVRAFKMVDGQRIFSGFSRWVSARTYHRGDKKVNAGGLSVVKSIDLSLLQTLVLYPRVKASKFGTNKKKRPYNNSVRYEVIGDSGVVSVSADGKISGVALGSTKVRVVAHNGTSSTVTVNVKDYTHPEVFDLSSLSENEPADMAIFELLTTKKKEVQDIAKYFLNNPVNEEIRFELDDDGMLKVIPGVHISDEIVEAITRVLVDHTHPIIINVHPGGRIFFDIGMPFPSGKNEFYYGNGVVYNPNSIGRIAPHWSLSFSEIMDEEGLNKQR